MEWFAEKLTDLYRPWYHDGLPEGLEFGEIHAWRFARGSMTRSARMAVAMDITFGIFRLLGIEYAQRAAQAWRPHERLLMEDLSCAFQPIWDRAAADQSVPRIHKDRLAFLLIRYLAYVKTPWPQEQIDDAIERFIADCPRGMEDEHTDNEGRAGFEETVPSGF